MTPKAEAFFELTPARILDAVEAAIGARATGRTLALNSIENRVYQIDLEDREPVVTKFYRPQRWTQRQILEEHEVTIELARREVPAVVPLSLANGSTLGQDPVTGLYFAVFDKARGRIRDELDDDRLKILGRFLARIHTVGASRGPTSRRAIDVETFGWTALDVLEDGGWLESNLGQRYVQVAETVLDRIEPRFEGVDTHLVHGDCHLGNVLWDNDHPFILDFDDMALAPPVQDLWMIVRGDDDEAKRARDVILEGYEEFRPFDRSTLSLIEPLRALRIIHYASWIAARWNDPSFPALFPHFGTDAWWLSELEALDRISANLDAES